VTGRVQAAAWVSEQAGVSAAAQGWVLAAVWVWASAVVGGSVMEAALALHAGTQGL